LISVEKNASISSAIRSVTTLDKALENDNVISEGAENIEQVNIAIQCGCSTFQDFYYHRPMTVEKIN
jgi:EAL domain-containing protein (putative c-di-GMP-specific phosphodiesterase class I)